MQENRPGDLFCAERGLEDVGVRVPGALLFQSRRSLPGITCRWGHGLAVSVPKDDPGDGCFRPDFGVEAGGLSEERYLGSIALVRLCRRRKRDSTDAPFWNVHVN